DTWYAHEGDAYLAVKTSAAATGSVGFVGASDLPRDLAENQQSNWRYTDTGSTRGNVSIALSLPALSHASASWDVAFGFGSSAEAARQQAEGSLETGFSQVAANYLGEGNTIGWKHYLQSLDGLEAIASQARDGGNLAYVSAL